MITVRNLTYFYPGASTPAVLDVSFTVTPGEIFGLLGPSGAGKSTTQKVLTGQHRRYQGEVVLLSRNLTSWDHSLYEHIGVGFELPNHFLRLTGRENLAFFGSLYPVATRDPMELLELVGLTHAADTRVDEYSKGMQMRLGFVRALLHDPEVIFLDEPTAGLDPVNAGVLKDLIREQQELGRTILLTTHNMMDVEQLCDRVGFLVRGAMSVVDAPRALKARYGQRSVQVRYANEAGLGASTDFPLDGLGHDAAFLELLRSCRIESLHSQEASLDRVFADVTGTSLAGEG